MNKNQMVVEELRSIILDKTVAELFAKDDEFSFLCAKYAKKVWISKEDNRFNNRIQHCPLNVFYNHIDIYGTTTSLNADVFLMYNKVRYIKRNYNDIFRFLEKNLKERGYIIIVSNSFFDKRAITSMIGLMGHSYQLEIIKNVKKFNYRYIVIKKKERRGMYGFF